MSSCSDLHQEHKESKQQLDFLINYRTDESPLELIDATQTSSYTEHYKTFFQHIGQFSAQELIRSRSQIFSQQKITFNSNEFAPEMTIIFISHSENWRVVNLLVSLVSLSYFTFEIAVLNCANFSPFRSELKPIGRGAMSEIYTMRDRNGSQFIIKSVEYMKSERDSVPQNEKNNFRVQRDLGEAIKEYCISKLCSVLEIGPKVLQQFGFDLVVFSHTVEFTLQHCEPVDKVQAVNFAVHLKVLHGLHIVHGDIKRENIMWSKSLRKVVLIDFGLATIVKEHIGEESFTHFFGTFSHCLPEMQSLLLKHGFGYVDFYYNDVHGLLVSEKEGADITTRQGKKKQQQFQCKQDEPNPDIEERILNFQLMRLIFDNDIKAVEQFCDCNNKIGILEETVELFELFPSSVILFRILCLLEERYLLSHPKVALYKNFHSGRVLQLRKSEPKNKENFEKRLKQHIRDSPMAITGTMLYLLLIYDQDVTPRAKYRKEELGRRLKEATETGPELARLLVEYCENLFTSKQDLLDMFEHVRKLLGLEEWSMVRGCYEVYEKAVEITRHFLVKHSVNLFKIYKQLQKPQQKFRYKIDQSKLKDYVTHLEVWIKTYQPILHNYTFKRDHYMQNRINYLQNLSITKNLIKILLQLNNSKREQCSSQTLQHDKFIIECSKFYAASKSEPILTMIELKQSEIMLKNNSELQTFIMSIKSEKTINKCFQMQIIIQFCFVKKLERQLTRHQPNISETGIELARLKDFIIRYLSSQSLYGVTFSFFKMIPKIQIYVNKQNSVSIMQMLQKCYMEIIAEAHTLKIRKSLECQTFIHLIFIIFLLYIKSDCTTLLQFLNAYDKSTTLVKVEQQLSYAKLIYIISRYELLVRLQVLSIEQKQSALQLLKPIINKQQHKVNKDIFIRYYIELLLIHYLTHTDANECVSKLESVIYKSSKQQIISLFQNKITLCPNISMFYASKTADYFQRAFRFLKFFIKTSKNEQNGFSLYLILRNCAWPYVVQDQLPSIIKQYMFHFDEIKKSDRQFYKNYANGVAILEMLISAIYTFKLFKQTYSIIPYMLLLVLQWMRYCIPFIRQRMANKYYSFVLKFVQKNIMTVKSESKLFYYCIKQFRNQQYPVSKKKIEYISKKLKFASNVIIQKSCSKIKDKIISWNSLKFERVDVVLKTNLGFQQTRIYDEFINQTEIEAGVTIKQLNSGFLQFTNLSKF